MDFSNALRNALQRSPASSGQDPRMMQQTGPFSQEMMRRHEMMRNQYMSDQEQKMREMGMENMEQQLIDSTAGELRRATPEDLEMLRKMMMEKFSTVPQDRLSVMPQSQPLGMSYGIQR